MNIRKDLTYLLFFDLDGTILFHNRIESSVRSALIRAKEKGHRIILNTGRSKAFLPDVIDTIPWDGLVCGTSYVEYHGQVLFNHPVPTDLLRIAVTYCVENKLPLRLEGVSSVYTTSPYDPFPNICDHYQDILPTLTDISKLTILQPISKYDVTFLQPYFDLVCLPTYTEALQIGITKATGITVIADYEHLPMAQTVAFGDSLNDLDMMKQAGLAAVMRSAPPELTAIADMQATEAETGVDELLTRYFLS